MKNFELKKEIWICLITLLPVIYLAYIWNSLPQIVPTHFDLDGQPNDWSNKRILIFLVPGMTLGVYLLLTFIPLIDPKGKLSGMGNKYFLFKLFMVLFMTIICFWCIQMSAGRTAGNINFLFVILGAFFAFLGNYMQSIKPNYFIGIRTPWTLESETVWRKTHLLGGKLYLVAGILVMILPFFLKKNFEHVFLPLILTASLIPVAYSFILFRQEKLKPKQ